MATAARKYWSMKAKGPKSAEILIYEQIGSGFWSEGIGAKQFAKDLKDLGDIDELTIRINSEGGSVFEGQAIYSQLKNHKAIKTVCIDGLAASIASVIAMAGDTIIMPENATMMIHDPWTIAMGDADDMRKSAEALDTIKLGIIAAYRNKTKKSDEEISELMTAETWMGAEEAYGHGFCDQINKPVEIAAMKFDLSKFKNVPQELFKTPVVPSTTPASESRSLNSLQAYQLAGLTKPKEVRKMSMCGKCGNPMVADECPHCKQETQNKAELKRLKENELERIKALRIIGREFKYEALAEYAIEQDWTEDQLRVEIMKRIKAGTPPNEPLHIKVTPNHEGRPFKTLGEQLVAVRNTALGKPDPRLFEVFDAPTGASENVDSDAGFLIQTDFTTSLLTRSNETMILAPRCFHIPITGNRIEAPVVDETSRATGSRWGGVRVYRTAEAEEVTKSKPKFASIEMKLEKIMGVFYATDETLSDISALETIASQAFVEEFGFKVDDEILRGSGAGEMQGILNAPALVSVSKETGQLAATIDAQNIIKMYSRMPARSKPNAVWLINSECMPQIMNLSLILGTAAVPLYFPPGGISQSPYGTIFGKSVIEIEQASALGTIGDIMFVDLSQYAIIEKGGINAAQSMHVKFLAGEMAYRWTARNNGQPIWKSALQPYKGSATLSPFIGLATR